MTDAIILVGFLSITALVLVTLAGLIRFAEKLSPRFSRWLDRTWPEGEAWREW